MLKVIFLLTTVEVLLALKEGRMYAVSSLIARYCMLYNYPLVFATLATLLSCLDNAQHRVFRLTDSKVEILPARIDSFGSLCRHVAQCFMINAILLGYHQMSIVKDQRSSANPAVVSDKKTSLLEAT